VEERVSGDDDSRFSPVELRAPKGAEGVEIDWADGLTTRYTNRTLRGFCPSASWQGHGGPLRFIAGGEEELLEVEEVGNYGVRLVWPDCGTGIYTFKFLRLLGEVEGDLEPLEFGR
jgi:DUF971 family protein